MTPKGTGTFTFSKSADPASGTGVLTGQTITYTITVSHHGDLPVRGARVSDDLSQLLDDMGGTGDVQASLGQVSIDGGVLSWTGDLGVGESATITYSVTVGQGGDGVLENAVTTDDGRGQCDTAAGCATRHAVTPGSFVFSKSADPASGSQVEPGQSVTYTITVRHAGGSALSGARVSDDLSQVLDDAVADGDVRASSGQASIDGGVLSWTGDLGVGESATITYSVKANGQGDRRLTNTVTSDDPRGSCDQGVGCMSDHDVAEVLPEPEPEPEPEPSPLPSVEPSPSPSVEPSPSPSPSVEPSPSPSAEPSPSPSAEPSPLPSAEPSPLPSAEPSPSPSVEPSPLPSVEPTASPTSPEPSPDPSGEPTGDPTVDPTAPPSAPGEPGSQAPPAAGLPTSSATAGKPAGGSLARTGAAAVGTMLLGGLALITGAALLAVRRREG